MVKHLARITPNLANIKPLLCKKDMDYFLGIIGYERSGKSNLAQAIAKSYIECPPHHHHKAPAIPLKFDKNHYAFSAEQLSEKVYTLPRGSPVIIDEGATTLFTMDAITPEGREATKLITVMGERNLFVIICVPDFFLLTPYIRNHRLKSLCRVVSRGRAAVYSKPTMRKIEKNKSGRVRYPAPTFVDSWQEQKGQLWNEYEKMKADYLRRRVRKQDKILGIKAVSEITGFSTSTIYDYCNRGLIPYMEILGRKKFRESDIAQLLIEHKSKV